MKNLFVALSNLSFLVCASFSSAWFIFGTESYQDYNLTGLHCNQRLQIQIKAFDCSGDQKLELWGKLQIIKSWDCLDVSTEFYWLFTDSYWLSTDLLRTSTDFMLTFTDFILTSDDFLQTSTDFLLSSTDFLLTSADFLLTINWVLLSFYGLLLTFY